MALRNLKLIVEYDGTDYHGWQYQDNVATVQGRLEAAIFGMTGETVRVTAAGRTDAGVHARGQVINFKTGRDFPTHRFLTGLNAYLPADIAVRSVAEVGEDFNARFSAVERRYRYYICTAYTALNRHACWQCFFEMDVAVLNDLAALLPGRHDFGAFCRVEVTSETKVCEVRRSLWLREGDMIVYEVSADRFLHGMVRTLVGTMVDAARGKTDPADFERVFRSRDRTLAGQAAPARGLVLEEVRYP